MTYAVIHIIDDLALLKEVATQGHIVQGLFLLSSCVGHHARIMHRSVSCVYVCVCFCVCEWERESKREGKRGFPACFCTCVKNSGTAIWVAPG